MFKPFKFLRRKKNTEQTVALLEAITNFSLAIGNLKIIAMNNKCTSCKYTHTPTNKNESTPIKPNFTKGGFVEGKTTKEHIVIPQDNIASINQLKELEIKLSEFNTDYYNNNIAIKPTGYIDLKGRLEKPLPNIVPNINNNLSLETEKVLKRKLVVLAQKKHSGFIHPLKGHKTLDSCFSVLGDLYFLWYDYPRNYTHIVTIKIPNNKSIDPIKETLKP